MEKSQFTFSGGVIDAGLHHRTDLPQVISGLKTSVNGFIDKLGNWVSRPGTRFLTETMGGSDHKSRIFPFIVSETEKYFIEIMGGTAGSSGDLVGLIRLLNEDGTKILLHFSDLNEWSPVGHANRAFTGVHQPFELVKHGNYFNVLDGAGKALTIHSNYTNTFLSTDFSISVNSTDNLSITYESSKITIKFANATPSKNQIQLIENAIQELGTINGQSTAHWWVVGNDAWSAAPPITGFNISGGGNKGIVKLNSNTTDYLSNTYAISDGDEIKEWTTYTDTDLDTIKYCQFENKIIFVNGKQCPKVLEFIDSKTWHFYDYDIVNGPFVNMLNTDFYMGIFWPSENGWLQLYSRKTNIIQDDLLIGSYVRFLNQVPAFKNIVNVIGIDTPDPIYSRPQYSNGLINWEFSGNFNAAGMYLTLQVSDDYINWRNADIENNIGVNANNAISTENIGYFDYGKQCLFRLKYRIPIDLELLITLTTNEYIHESIVQLTSRIPDSKFYFTPKNLVYGYYPGVTFHPESTDTYISQFNEFFGWPENVYFYQNRLGFAASKGYPATHWESKTGLYNNFGTSVPILASDSINIDISPEKKLSIKNVVTFRDLFLLTDSAEISFLIDQSGYGPLNIPTDRLESSNGSSSTPPMKLDRSVLYINNKTHTLRAFRWEGQLAGYVGHDISMFSSDYFNGREITRMVYQKYPWQLAWFLRDDGKLISLNYNMQSQMMAFSLHSIAYDGIVEDICVIEGDTSNLFLIINHNGARFVEVLDNREFESLEDAYFVDSGVSYDLETATDTFSVPHLTNFVLSILADGWPQVITNTTGTITLSKPAKKVHIGLMYESILEPIHYIVGRKDSNGHAINQNLHTVKVKFDKSVLDNIGTDSGIDFTLHSRKTDPTQPEELFTGWRKYVLKSRSTNETNWDASQLYFRQFNPYPVTIQAIIAEID